MSASVSFLLLGTKHILCSEAYGYSVDGEPLKHVIKRNNEFSIALRALLLVKGIQALMLEGRHVE